ncbi:MAG TPA: M24 family metallopeptidase [Bryobacteraceae bacterium]|nr:M24 family metallopeptidase [Bryobacteraceae bacterium]
MTTAAEAARAPLRKLLQETGLEHATIGYECEQSHEPASYVAMHLYGASLAELFEPASLRPAEDFLGRMKAVLTGMELEGVRRSCRIARLAFEAGRAELAAGMKESEAAAAFRLPLFREGIGFEGTRRADGYAACMAGANASEAYGGYARSRAAAIRAGDLVLSHCNSYADGYWTDITRTYSMGPPNERQRAMYEAVWAARAAALAAIGPGVKASEVDRAARQEMRRRRSADALSVPDGGVDSMMAHAPFPRRPLPPMARIGRALPSEHIAGPRGYVRERLLAAGLAAKVKPGARIAITAGSRGIGGFTQLLAGIADAVKECRGEPFLIQAMGSHGGATAEGQTKILNLLGVDGAVGAPIRATMDTLELGTAKNGAVAHLDAMAAAADGIIVFGRTKTHPEGGGEGFASGLLKMTTIGLGKQRGAQQAHNHGLWESVEQVPEITIAKSKILFGVAVVENGYRQPVAVEVVPARYDAFLESDRKLLEVAKPHVARLPFDKLDLLIVDEIGKTISGSGMDLNVIGKFRATGKGPNQPEIKRIVALSLTKPSLGNALGAGLADFVTRRLMDAYDPAATYINLLTAMEPESTTREGPLPLALETDREAIEVGLYSTLADRAPRVCRIQSTASLSEMWVSAALLDEIRNSPGVAVEEPPRELPFQASGNLW